MSKQEKSLVLVTIEIETDSPGETIRGLNGLKEFMNHEWLECSLEEQVKTLSVKVVEPKKE